MKTKAQKDRHEQIRVSLQVRVDELPRGARAEISRDLGTAPTTISSALNGQQVLPHVLDKIEQWLVIYTIENIGTAPMETG